jgi:histone demethylase JARID1
MAYIDSIAPEAKKYGICKIVPPEGWQMPFELDTEKFRFMTRLQRLNSIEAASRAKINFLEQLSMFHKQQGDTNAHVPVVNHKLLDLWRLRKEVNTLGGIDEVNRLKAWTRITEDLGYTATFVPQIRSAYTKLILPFETWALRAKSYPESPLTPLPTASASANGKAAGSGPLASPDTPVGKHQGRMTGMGAGAAGAGAHTSPRGNGNGSAALSAAGPALAAVVADPHAGPSAAPNSASPGSHALSVPPASSDSGLAAPIRIKVSGFHTSSHGSDSELSEEESSRTSTQSSTPPQPQAKYEKGDVSDRRNPHEELPLTPKGL